MKEQEKKKAEKKGSETRESTPKKEEKAPKCN
jgi:hypothetical protein